MLSTSDLLAELSNLLMSPMLMLPNSGEESLPADDEYHARAPLNPLV